MAPEPDRERALELRQASLERAGYDPESARTLAERLDVPLRDALAVLRAGFPAKVAAEMLLRGERPVF